MSVPLSLPDIIGKKRDGEELSTREIQWFIQQVVSGKAQDCQIGAMLMAMYIKGLTNQETVDLTTAMVQSGDKLKWDESWTMVDKHSTGGVGDKVSLPLAPALATFGLKVPMVSGRGLAFTGGTLDKLESIPGYNVNCSVEEMRKALTEVGCFIAGPTQNLAPGDKELYKRRDVTATVPSTPLIVASIISKKVAEGAKVLVMDIKVGKAAFYKDVKAARDLAKHLVKVSAGLGVTTKAALTRMDTPIGRCVGNALEVAESIECLRGKGPHDLVDLVSTTGGLILQMKKLAKSLEEGKAAIKETLINGKALECFCKMLVFQGVSQADANELCNGDMWKVLPSVPPNQITKLNAHATGVISKVDAMDIANACWWLGAGRSQADQPIDYRVGVRLLRVEGDTVTEGEPWIEVHHAQPDLQENIRNTVESAITIVKGQTTKPQLSRIIEIL